MNAVATAVAASASAKAPKAAGSDSVCAMAPVMSGAGRRLSALNSEAEASPTAGPAAAWRAANAKPHGTIGPVPTPIRAKPATLAANPACSAYQSEAGRRDHERSDDHAKVADAKANGVDIEAQRGLTSGKERRAEAGNRRQLRRLLAQQQRRPHRRREFRRDRDTDDDAKPNQRRREGQSASPYRPDHRRSGTIGLRRAVVGDARACERERGENARRPRRRPDGDQTAEYRAKRHAGRRSAVQPSQNRASQPSLDPRALGVHEHVDHATDEPRDDERDRDPSFTRGVEQRA